MSDLRHGRAREAAATETASGQGPWGPRPTRPASGSQEPEPLEPETLAAAYAETGRGVSSSELATEATVSALDHKMREGALLTAHRLLMLLVLVSSSSAVFVLVAYAPEIGAILALIPGLAGALDMTFAFSQRASDHAVLARRFLDLAAEVQTSSDGAKLRVLQAQLFRLYGEEPPTYEAVYATAYNQVCRREGRDEMVLRVTWPQRLLKNVVRFAVKTYAPRAR